MSQAPPPIPPPGQPPSAPPGQPFPPRPRPRGGSIWLGLLVGVVAIGAFIFIGPLIVNALYASLRAEFLGMLGFLFWVPPIAYLAGSIVLAAREETSQFGAGLLLAIGIWILLGAGICFAIVTQLGGSA